MSLNGPVFEIKYSILKCNKYNISLIGDIQRIGHVQRMGHIKINVNVYPR